MQTHTPHRSPPSCRSHEMYCATIFESYAMSFALIVIINILTVIIICIVIVIVIIVNLTHTTTPPPHTTTTKIVEHFGRKGIIIKYYPSYVYIINYKPYLYDK